ncbi:precorrin-2 C20-methyltransferase [Gloeothece citriformis PCC 7424]|uniref:Precorrin-2 C20-methyltransferase n=1 Tax=Gloeothece citriformis (strain PCC 7424) TaxID=65393 RepID=B7KBP8_GLOC7|nr:precorrin-2 C(20)-methyltransferase [Gloeothece citriformis]ACK73026.1 precorrin-2 C20-methyltransferase [Gloeothece citriformis PCC 7424]
MSDHLGILSGISVGTGDPELITVKGLKVLQKASVVAFPSGIKGHRGIAEQIVFPWLLETQHTLPLHFPYVQDEEVLQQAWQEAANQVWHYLKLGEDVAFVCEGDISFYSTFTYLAQTLKELHPEVNIQTIPGVCSPMAAASQLGIPLTVRSQRLVILPAIYTVDELDQVLNWADVVVLMKFSSVYPKIWQLLKERNLLNHSWIVEKATFPEQVIYRDLQDKPQLKLSYFSLFIINIY